MVFHVYDCMRLDAPPRRYTVEAQKSLEDVWPEGAYNVQVFGPNGFFRRYAGGPAIAWAPRVNTRIEPMIGGPINFTLGFEIAARGGKSPIRATPGAYADVFEMKMLTPVEVGKPPVVEHRWSLMRSGGWYDFVLRRDTDLAWERRFAGRHEIGVGSLTSDPAMAGAAVMTWV